MMWNAEKIGTPVDQLCATLPAGWQLELQPEVEVRRHERRSQLDALLTMRAPDGTQAIWAVAWKSGSEPRQIDLAIAQLHMMTELPGLVIAPFLSEESRRRIVAAGMSYADMTGNVRLVHDRSAVFVLTTGAERNPEREMRTLRSLKGDGSGRVVRALIDFAPPYGVRELASRATLPTGTTARVVELLEREALLHRDPKGRILAVNWVAVLRHWAQDRGSQRRPMAHYLEPRGLAALLQKLGAYKGGYTVSGSLAAALWEPIAPARLATLHAFDPADLIAELGLRRVDAGGNVRVVEALSPGPLERAIERDGVLYAAPSQVVADLMNGPGREPAEAEALLVWMEANPDAWRT